MQSNVGYLIVALYVDGLFLPAEAEQALDGFKAQLEVMFDLMYFGAVSKYQGVKFRGIKCGYAMSQQNFLLEYSGKRRKGPPGGFTIETFSTSSFGPGSDRKLISGMEIYVNWYIGLNDFPIKKVQWKIRGSQDFQFKEVRIKNQSIFFRGNLWHLECKIILKPNNFSLRIARTI